MRKLIESTLVSLDGVVESPERWAIFDDEATERSLRVLDQCEAFVMGRLTYERFRENWGAGGNPYLDRIGAMPKYVASRSLTDLTWNATLLDGNVVAAIRDLKARPGKDLIKYGNGRLDATLLGAQLVDELRVWIMPVVAGSGRRMLEGADASAIKLTLTEVTKLRNGSAILTYVPTVEPDTRQA
jgi:dihydrofolate reductase